MRPAASESLHPGGLGGDGGDAGPRSYATAALDTPPRHPFHSTPMRSPIRQRTPLTTAIAAAGGFGLGTTTITSTTTVVRRVVRE